MRFSVDSERCALVGDDGRVIRLPRARFALVEALAEGRGRVMPRDFLMDRMGCGLHNSDRLCDSAVKRLRREVEKTWPAAHDPIGVVYGVGYYWRASPEDV